MLHIREQNGQKGLYSDRPIGRGERIIDLSKGELVADRTQTSIQIDDHLHSEHDLARYMNHKDFYLANCAIDGHWVVAIRGIPAGEELTFDYTTNEDSITHPFQDRDTGKHIGHADS